jgi:hypothetical protein
MTRVRFLRSCFWYFFRLVELGGLKTAGSIHSALSVIAGSTRAACRAGCHVATSAVASIVAPTSV